MAGADDLLHGGDAEASSGPTQTAAPLAHEVDALHAGVCFGRFMIERRLGQGGLGVVYRASDPRLRRPVALKLLRSRDSDAGTLLREARTVAQVAHPNVVAVYEVGDIGGVVFMAMELVDGASLRTWAKTVPKTRAGTRRVLAVLAAAARGLAAAHDRGIVHRDIKPDNIVVGADDTPRLVDFGLAVEISRTDDALSTSGTPAYMAPEQRRGEFTAASDQYGFCVACYELLALARPGAERAERPRPSVPRAIWATVRRGLAADPARRNPGMAIIAARFAAAARPLGPRLASIGAVVAATALAAAAWISRPGATNPCAPNDGAWRGTWDAGQRTALFGQFPAEPRVASLAFELDAYRAAWTTSRAQICRDARVEHRISDTRHDAAMACLERGQAQVHRVLARLRDAPDDVDWDTLAQLRRALDDPEGCATDVPLSGGDRRIALERDLDELKALIQTGSRRDIDPDLGLVVDRARRLGNLPLVADALSARARALEDRERYEQADAAWGDAALAAGQARDDRRAALAFGARAFVRGYHLARTAEAWPILDAASAFAARLGSPAELVAVLEHQRGTLAVSAGEFDVATESLTKALALAISTRRVSFTSLAWTLNNLGVAELSREHCGVALAWFSLARVGLELGNVVNVPLRMSIPNNEGNCYRDLGLLERAEASFAEAEAALASGVDVRASDQATLAISLGLVALDRGLPALARSRLEKALSITTGLRGERHPDVGIVLTNLGNAMMDLGQPAMAAEDYLRSLAIKELHNGPDHASIAIAATAACDALTETGALIQAGQLCDRALAVRLRTLGERHLRTAYTQIVLGHQRTRAGALPQAQAAFAAADARFADLADDDRSYLRAGQAWWALRAGQPARARNLAGQAVALAASPDVTTTRRSGAYRALAAALAATGDRRDEGRAWFAAAANVDATSLDRGVLLARAGAAWAASGDRGRAAEAVAMALLAEWPSDRASQRWRARLATRAARR